MSVKKLLVLGLVLTGFVVLSIGCRSGATPDPQPAIEPPESEATSVAGPTAENTPTGAGNVVSATPNPDLDAGVERPLYRLSLELDVDNRQARVEETIRWPNSTGQPVDTLPLVIEPQRYAGVFALQEILWDQGTIVVEPSDKNLLWLKLEKPLEPGELLSLHLNYELILPEIPPPSEYLKPQVFGYTSRQINLVDWYPFVPPFRDGDWLIHSPGYFGEHLVYSMADFEVTLTLAGRAAGWIVASSAPLQDQEDTATFHFVLAGGRTFALSLSPYYEVISQQIGDVKIFSYAFSESKAAGQAALDATARALSVFSALFKPYTHKTLSIVEADFLDGMEFDGLYFLSKGFYNLYDGTPKGYLTMIAAHETAHQWWFGMVGNDQALDPWMDEALCTYSERLFYEAVYPDLVDWWWSYRVNFYQPEGAIDLSIYDYQGYQAYRNAVYLRGAMFFEDMRRAMGDEPFFSALQTYARQYEGRVPTAGQFLEIFTKNAPEDVTPVLKRYFSREDLLTR